MYSEKDILTRAWLVKEIVNIALEKDKLSVDKIFLIGSYATGRATEWSDIDFLVELKGTRFYPTWVQIQDIHEKLDTSRIHVIFGTEEAQISLKAKNENMHYRQIPLEGVHNDTDSHSTVT